jgi:hypothetical protein
MSPFIGLNAPALTVVPQGCGPVVEALQAMARLGLTPRLRGAGLVVEQQPPAGSPIDIGVRATLWLRRQAVQTALAP